MTAIRHVAVIGAGTMGAGIAQAFAQAGFRVHLHDASATVLERARATIVHSLGKFVEKETLSPGARDAALRYITTTSNLDDAAAADFVVEAVDEDRAVKRAVFAALDRICRPDIVLASNTSSIAISTLRGGDRPATARRRHALHESRPADAVGRIDSRPGDQRRGDARSARPLRGTRQNAD